jgi:hypothetical protein
VPTRRLPSSPSVEHLRKEAKALQRRHADGDPDAVALVQEFHPRASRLDGLKLADAQLVVARSYGLPSWPRLRGYVEAVTEYARPSRDADGLVDRFLRLACLTYVGDGPERRQEARELLAANPELARASIHTAAAVGDAAAAADALARDRALATARGGPHDWEPLLYAAYSRLELPERSTLDVARLLLEHGADPNAGWVGGWGPPPFTARSAMGKTRRTSRRTRTSSSSPGCCSTTAPTRTTGRRSTTTCGAARTSTSSSCSSTGWAAATAVRGSGASRR